MQSRFRLLVVRLGAMGDILHALPAVTALRRTHPCWIIDWLVDTRWRALLAADHAFARDTSATSPLQPVVDSLHLADTRRWKAHPASASTLRHILSLRRALGAGAYDAVLDLQGSIRSAVLARFTGSHCRIGESSPREGFARAFYTVPVSTSGAHVIEQDIELANAVAGDELLPELPLLPFDPAAEDWSSALLSDPLLPTVLVNPGAGWGAKRWPVERYAEVARALLNRGFRVLVNAGPGEIPLAQQIVERTGGGAQPLVCTLPQLIAVTRRVDLVLAGDTGPLHLACALGRPVVGIYGPTDPARNGPFGTRFRVLRSPQSRRDHTRRAEPEAGLLTISAEDVLHSAEELLYPEAAR